MNISCQRSSDEKGGSMIPALFLWIEINKKIILTLIKNGYKLTEVVEHDNHYQYNENGYQSNIELWVKKIGGTRK